MPSSLTEGLALPILNVGLPDAVPGRHPLGRGAN